MRELANAFVYLFNPFLFFHQELLWLCRDGTRIVSTERFVGQRQRKSPRVAHGQYVIQTLRKRLLSCFISFLYSWSCLNKLSGRIIDNISSFFFSIIVLVVFLKTLDLF
jgi:hypothetical protein